MSKVKTGGEIWAFGCSRPVWEECGPCHVFACYAMAVVLKMRVGGGKHGKHLSQGSWKVGVGHDSVCRHGHDRTASVHHLYTYSYPETNEDIPITS